MQQLKRYLDWIQSAFCRSDVLFQQEVIETQQIVSAPGVKRTLQRVTGLSRALLDLGQFASELLDHPVGGDIGRPES